MEGMRTEDKREKAEGKNKVYENGNSHQVTMMDRCPCKR